MKYLLTVIFFLAYFHLAAQPQAAIFEQYKKDRSVMPDFSYVGYHCGETTIPTGKGLKIFNVTDYGAVPDDDVSDKKAIEKAIADAEKAYGGIINFPKGRFLVQEDNDQRSSVWISGSNIILRGSGSGEGGTELFMKNPLNPADPEKMWTVPPLFIFGSQKDETPIGKIIRGGDIGSFQIGINETGGLKKGDWIMLEMSTHDSTSLKLDLGSHLVDPEWTGLYNDGIQLKVYHQIAAIKGNTLTLKQPLAYPVNSKLEWKVSRFNAVEEIGIEDIAFTGNWKEPFVHHRSWLHDSGFTMINMRRIVNSWMKDCRFTNVSVATIVNSGANISVLNCRVTGNGGHEAISNAGGTNILLGKITDEASMWHSVGTSKTSMNTVLWRVAYPSTTCFESHASQPRNTLLDCVEGGLLNNRGGGALASMPNHLRNLVLWNYKQTNKPYTSFEFWPDRKYWKIPYPTVVGFHGTGTTFKNDQLAYNESIGTKVSPESLYEAQLKLRLKKLPEWMDKVALIDKVLPEQEKFLIKVSNPLNEIRNAETIEIPWNDVKKRLKNAQAGQIIVEASGQQVPSQIIYRGSKKPRAVIFQTDISANTQQFFTIQKGKPETYTQKTYGRIVPERFDDFAWENDRIAFRMYGAALEEQAGNAKGIDVWLKRTSNLVINKWYSQNNYHLDHGEGVDAYHVGMTLGAGNSAPITTRGLVFPKNYSKYKILDQGPVRITFQLIYDPWNVDGKKVKHIKTISLDAGSNLNKITDEYEFKGNILMIAAGITKHKSDGSAVIDTANRFVSYWDQADGKVDNGKVGVAVLIPDYEAVNFEDKLDHLLASASVSSNQRFVYYQGGGWDRSGYFNKEDDWTDYLKTYSRRVKVPLKISYKN